MWLESRHRLGGLGRERDGEIVEDGSQRVHGARTGPLSVPRTHVSFSNKVLDGRPHFFWAVVFSSSFIHGSQAASCAALTLFTGAK